jgi:transcription elongation factor GreB
VSRAFVKDGDDRPETPPPRPVSGRLNYVTVEGFASLRAAFERARDAGDRRNAEYYEERIASAVLVEAHSGAPGTIAFGSTVVAREPDGTQRRVRIVGEDEADPIHGTIGWASPYAQALAGHRAGDRVVVQRPAGAATVVVESVETL